MVIRAVPEPVSRSSCRSAEYPLPALTTATARYELSAITSSPAPYPSWEIKPCHQVRTGLPAYCWTRRSSASRPPLSGSNHTSAPLGSKIIGPYCPGPEVGSMNTSPESAPGASVRTAMSGGPRSGREWKLWMSWMAPKRTAGPGYTGSRAG